MRVNGYIEDDSDGDGSYASAYSGGHIGRSFPHYIGVSIGDSLCSCSQLDVIVSVRSSNVIITRAYP